MREKQVEKSLFENVRRLISQARSQVVQSINITMVYTYFEIGRLIVEHEQYGENRAEYGIKLLQGLSTYLTKEFGKGFSVTNIQQMRNFYLIYRKQQTLSVKSIDEEKSQTLSAKLEFEKSETVSRKFVLSWSHYIFLMRLDDAEERHFYEIESYNNNWSLRELKRQFNSALYQRLSLSRDKKGVRQLAQKGHIVEAPKDAIKDPYVLEFIGLPELQHYSESDLEQRLIDKLEHFLLELGKGFTFVARQQRITIDEKHFHIDLVFYNRLLRAFVLIDLKIGELRHKDLGQMMMYVNYYDRNVKLKDENKTVGIILCRHKSEALVEMTLPENNDQIFASKYLTVLPSKKELQKLLEEA